MKASRIGRSSVTVTGLGLGTAQLGDLYGPLSPSDAQTLVDTAWEGGIRYFDTAPHYGLGLAERRLGDALRGRARNEYALSSKVGRLIVDTAVGPARRWDFSADGIERSIAESLERLGLDRLDLVLIHDPQDHLAQAVDEAYPALDLLRRQGAIGAVGVGSGDVAALTAFARSTDVDALMVAGRLTLLEQPAARELVPLCERRGISILNAAVFNSGLLATDAPAADAHYEYGTVDLSRLRRAQDLAELARRHGVTLPQAALRFASEQPQVASVVVGADSAAQLTETLVRFERDAVLTALWADVAALDPLVTDGP